MDFQLAKAEFSKIIARVNACTIRTGVQDTEVMQCINDCEALINTFYSAIPQVFSRQIIPFRYSTQGSVYQRLKGLEGVLKSIVNDIDIRSRTQKVSASETTELISASIKQSQEASKMFNDLLDEWNDLVPRWNALSKRVDEELEPAIEREIKARRKYRMLFFVVTTMLLSYINISIPFVTGWQDWNKITIIQIIILVGVFLAYNDTARVSLFDFGKKHTVEGIGRAYQALILVVLTLVLIMSIWYFFKIDLPKEYEERTAPRTDTAK
jgi:hypothetical protein